MGPTAIGGEHQFNRDANEECTHPDCKMDNQELHKIASLYKSSMGLEKNGFYDEMHMTNCGYHQ